MARGKVRGKPLWMKQLAQENIKSLFSQARKQFREDRELAHAQVKAARRLSMKYKVRIPKELRRQMCKHCYRYLMPGANVRIRTKNGKVVYYCLECKKFMRFMY